MSTTTLETAPIRTLNGAQRQYVETYGSALVMNTFLKILSFLLALGLCGSLAFNFRIAARYADLKPLVLRIDPDGSAKVSTYDEAAVYRPQVPEVRFHLRKFVEHFYSRQRATLRVDFTHALYFLDPGYRDQKMGDRARRAVYDTFRTDPVADDLTVTVENLTLSELVTPPFRAAVYLTRQAYTAGTLTPRGAPVKEDLEVEFYINDKAPKWMRDENPIGLQITSMRGFEAFK